MLAVALIVPGAPAAGGAGRSCYGMAPTRVGTAGPDELWGTAGDDVIVGLAGDDRVHASAGVDRVCGGPGADQIAGGAGDDRLDGGFGRDVLYGGEGADALRGGPGSRDLCFGDGGGGWRTACERQAFAFPIRPSGVARYGPYHHDYPATDIFAPAGTPVVAVTSGVVDEVSRSDPWDPGEDDPATRGGLFVSIIGDDCVRYYGSHLQTVAAGIAAGVRVRAGQVVGYVGNSGNAAWTASHLHFGISRPTEPGDWEVRRGQVSSFPFLRAWEAGHGPSPRGTAVPALLCL